MKLLFVGATRLGKACLTEIMKTDEVEVVGILTAPRHFSISYAPTGVTNVLHASFDSEASNLGCPLLTLEGRMNDANLYDRIERLNPEVILVVGWYHMIPNSWIARWPVFGLHASLLPKFAGGAPLVWALIEGERKVGISFFQFDSGVDSGPIVSQISTRVRRRDDIGSVLIRVEQLAIRLVRDNVTSLMTGIGSWKQQDTSRRTVYPQRGPQDGLIQKHLGPKQLRNFVRAQTHPYPGAFISCGNKKIIIWSLSFAGVSFKEGPFIQIRNGIPYFRTRCLVYRARSFDVIDTERM